MNVDQALAARTEAAPVEGRTSSVSSMPELSAVDPRMAGLIRAEEGRQQAKLILIASESHCPPAIHEAVGSCLSNLYAEGYPSSRMARWERELLDWDARHLSFYRRYGDRRYYKGCDVVNLIEAESIKRVANLFATDDVPADRIFANLQVLSGAAANNAVYEALVPAGSTILGLDLSCGGHLTHGSPVNRSGKQFRVVGYGIDPKTGAFDFDQLKEIAVREKPKIIIAGFSAYPWTIDWKAFREVADAAGAYLLADISHTAGLVAGREFPSPVGHAHVITFTTHKTLCGPRGAAVLTTDPELARKIDFAVFPGEQGGPHIHSLAGRGVAFHMADSDEFRQLMRRVRENAAALAKGLAEGGMKLGYGGTDTHLCLIDLSDHHPEGSAADSLPVADVGARVLDLVGITCNKNAIAGDTRAAHPSGLRFGTTWVTQRGLGPDDMAELADIICTCLQAAKTFAVHSSAGRVGRVRLPARVLRDCQARVRKLLERGGDGAGSAAPAYPHYESAGPFGVERAGVLSGAPAASQPFQAATLADTSAAPVIHVRGERSAVTLHLALTGDVLGLAPDQSLTACALEPDGRVIGDVRVARLANDELGFPQFLLLGTEASAQAVVQWLRDLSDGYVEVDEDLYRKIDGPIVVDDLGSTSLSAERQRVVLTVAGPGLDASLQGAELPVVTSGSCATATFEGDPAFLVRHQIGDLDSVEIVVPPARAEALSKALGLTGVATAAEYHTARGAAGAPAEGDRLSGLDAVPAAKPFFVGQSTYEVSSDVTAEPFVAPTTEGELRKTPIHGWHAANTKKFNLVPFAGWEMPVMYTSIVNEHRAVRTAGGLFDVAHMGVLEVTGEHAAHFLDLVTTNYVLRMRDGDGHYSYALDPTGAVMDDLLIYRRAADRFLVVVNAANADQIEAWWRGVLAGRHSMDAQRPWIRPHQGVEIANLKDPAVGDRSRVDLAFQGPLSYDILVELADEATRTALARLGRFQITDASIAGLDVLVARTGYTGEEVGYEMYVHPDRALELWEAILAQGAERGVIAAGLGARDSLRTEAGFPLYGHELAGEHQISPHGAGYSSFVKWHKPFFVGRDPLLANEATRDQRIVRVKVTDPKARPIREGDTIVDARGRFVGRVTSAAYAGAEQILLGWVQRKLVKKGMALGAFPLPRGGKKLPIEPAKDELKSGDSVLLPIPVQVLTRFMRGAEKKGRSYQR